MIVGVNPYGLMYLITVYEDKTPFLNMINLLFNKIVTLSVKQIIYFIFIMKMLLYHVKVIIPLDSFNHNLTNRITKQHVLHDICPPIFASSYMYPYHYLVGVRLYILVFYAPA